MSTNENAISSRKSARSFFGKMVRNQMFIPLAALLLLILFNIAADIFLHVETSFFKVVLEREGFSQLGSVFLLRVPFEH